MCVRVRVRVCLCWERCEGEWTGVRFSLRVDDLGSLRVGVHAWVCVCAGTNVLVITPRSRSVYVSGSVCMGVCGCAMGAG